MQKHMLMVWVTISKFLRIASLNCVYAKIFQVNRVGGLGLINETYLSGYNKVTAVGWK